MTDDRESHDHSDGSDRPQPIRLYPTIVAEPLNDFIKRDGVEAPQDVVIDLNFKFVHGLAEAGKIVLGFLKELGVPDDRINKRKSDLTPQYIFATMMPEEIWDLARRVYQTGDDSKSSSPIERALYMIWPDFELDQHVTKSAATIKADAAQRSFSAVGNGIVWAVLDSGVDGCHRHFVRHDTLNLQTLETPLHHMDFTRTYPDQDADHPRGINKQEQEAALTDQFGHGTHVAGLIAGEYVHDEEHAAANGLKSYREKAMLSRLRRSEDGKEAYQSGTLDHVCGIAPLCKILSVKVLDDAGKGKVSNILAALAQIQSINENGRWIKIHGVNLSLGYGFNPEWFACGHSPFCVEVDRLVRSGVVVVVSAGNSGYGTRKTVITNTIRSGLLMTINDPGNAELAITVGSTHRDMPHVFGASFFSSKGPTGDGRRKPDLLAPGERIISCGAGHEAERRGFNSRSDLDRLYLDQSGTSMAAPHVSGAIAAFLSIRREFIGKPERVKQIFMDTATDLGRERYMQGAGLVDLMRAIQSV